MLLFHKSWLSVKPCDLLSPSFLSIIGAILGSASSGLLGAFDEMVIIGACMTWVPRKRCLLSIVSCPWEAPRAVGDLTLQIGTPT